MQHYPNDPRPHNDFPPTNPLRGIIIGAAIATIFWTVIIVIWMFSR